MNKTKFIIITIIFAFSLVGCKTSLLFTKKITVVGIALDAKLAAVVVLSDSSHYYLYGVDHWDKKYYGKIVIVKGKVIKKPGTPIEINSPKQVIIDDYYIIKRPKYHLHTEK
jgi:hypothetical protein